MIYQHSWTSRHDAELATFEWIEGWYNKERIMDCLGMQSPDEYEHAYNSANATRVGESTRNSVSNKAGDLTKRCGKASTMTKHEEQLPVGLGPTAA